MKTNTNLERFQAKKKLSKSKLAENQSRTNRSSLYLGLVDVIPNNWYDVEHG